MNHWKETADIVSRLRTLAAASHGAALATVVRTSGSAYRRPGAKLLVADSGETLGSVSGGCLEADIREVALGVIDTGRPVLRHYDAGVDDDLIGALGLGCNGSVDVFVQPATSGPLSTLLGRLSHLLAGDAPITIATVVSGPDAGSVKLLDQAPSAHDVKVFVDVLEPPPHLLVCGAGTDAIPLVAYAAEVGFRVTVADHRAGLLAPERFPKAFRRTVAYPADPELVLPPPTRTLAVVKTHSLAHDRDWIRLLLSLDVPYVGVLGPRDRTDRMLRDIGADHDRVFGPVGLDLGADGAHQVAISIVAELLAFVSKREPRHLRQRRAPIHAE